MNGSAERGAIKRQLVAIKRHRMIKTDGSIALPAPRGEWVLFEEVEAYYQTVDAILARAHQRAEMADARTAVAEDALARAMRELKPCIDRCDEQATLIALLRKQA
jgi:hypothetical protein